MTDSPTPEEILTQNIMDLVARREIRALRDELITHPPADIASLLVNLAEVDRLIIFRILPREIASDVFSELELDTQEALLSELGDERIAKLLEEMSPDDRTAFFEELPAAAVRKLLLLLSREERQVAATLLGYPESSVGRLMTPDYITVREDFTMQEVLAYVRKHGEDSDSLNVIYVVDGAGKLIDDIRIREVLLAEPETTVRELMNYKFQALVATDDQETAVDLFRKYGRTVLPVVDSQGILIGIVTIDDVLEVAEEEATEDIQKLGAVEALDEPYIKISLLELVRKRANWLVILFIGEGLTATAMTYFEDEIARAVVLALFVPLIISSGGNSGSQAATLVIRALAIGEIDLKDWKRVFLRELGAGLMLGSILGIVGFLRVALWSAFLPSYGPHWLLIGLTVACSLVGVVLWGTLTGSMLPFLLKRLKLDPATSSAPFVATLVDVTGLIIYFTFAALFLTGVLL